ncbi:HNH endonuclease signature motif containing protein [Streptomyces sp. NPDC005065]|uniref:HNH endonuclease n=1 Tax=Streptomyces sp. NPDC005065 TaxID=3154461 RepID=UPI0033AAD3CC
MLASGRRRAVKYGVTADKVTAQEVHAYWYASKLLACHLCGLSFSTVHPISLDHVEPLSKGGTHTLANFAPAHRWCNTQKGNRPAERYRRGAA